jgi:hypothetical protein
MSCVGPDICLRLNTLSDTPTPRSAANLIQGICQVSVNPDGRWSTTQLGRSIADRDFIG